MGAIWAWQAWAPVASVCTVWGPASRFRLGGRSCLRAQSHLLLSRSVLLMEKYRKCGFSRLWAASAFKGATGPHQALPPIEHHVRNNMQWLQVAACGPADALQGVILTGWQR